MYATHSGIGWHFDGNILLNKYKQVTPKISHAEIRYDSITGKPYGIEIVDQAEHVTYDYNGNKFIGKSENRSTHGLIKNINQNLQHSEIIYDFSTSGNDMWWLVKLEPTDAWNSDFKIPKSVYDLWDKMEATKWELNNFLEIDVSKEQAMLYGCDGGTDEFENAVRC